MMGKRPLHLGREGLSRVEYICMGEGTHPAAIFVVVAVAFARKDSDALAADRLRISLSFCYPEIRSRRTPLLISHSAPHIYACSYFLKFGVSSFFIYIRTREIERLRKIIHNLFLRAIGVSYHLRSIALMNWIFKELYDNQ